MAFTLAQINDLVNAGYDLQEILAVNGPVENPVNNVNNPAPDPTPSPAPDPTPSPAPVHTETGNSDLLNAINNLTNIIQSGNIRMGGFPAPVNPTDPQEILASIINPPTKTGKK